MYLLVKILSEPTRVLMVTLDSGTRLRPMLPARMSPIH
jgi:hypothetical protein